MALSDPFAKRYQRDPRKQVHLNLITVISQLRQLISQGGTSEDHALLAHLVSGLASQSSSPTCQTALHDNLISTRG